MRPRRRAVLFLVLAFFAVGSARADRKDLLAHEIFARGNPERAAELFTDPTWKAASLYRSAQWWRAAELWLRGDTADDAYNLGNTYVQMGYAELALEAYLRALALQPDHEDAAHNADIVRQLLALNQGEQGQSNPGREESAIDTLDSDNEQAPEQGAGGEEQAEPPDGGTGEQEQGGDTARDQRDAGQETSGGSGTEDEGRDRPPDGDNRQALDGMDAPDSATAQAGQAESDGLARDESRPGGLREQREREQATTQWLNRIQRDPRGFLERRIRFERQRRRELGIAPAAGGGVW